MTWQPIETAPTDDENGCIIFVPSAFQGKGGVFTAVYVMNEWRILGSYLRNLNSTHWMPLPPPPEENK